MLACSGCCVAADLKFLLVLYSCHVAAQAVCATSTAGAHPVTVTACSC